MNSLIISEWGKTLLTRNQTMAQFSVRLKRDCAKIKIISCMTKNTASLEVCNKLAKIHFQLTIQLNEQYPL